MHFSENSSVPQISYFHMQPERGFQPSPVEASRTLNLKPKDTDVEECEIVQASDSALSYVHYLTINTHLPFVFSPFWPFIRSGAFE
jgi:hypothetical protein